jgi:hypothetical protein
MLRKFVVTAAIAALSMGSASAQAPAGPSKSSAVGIPLKSDKPLTQEEIERRKANDRAYDAALQKIPDKKPPADPWGNVRPSSPAAAKNKQDNKAN